MISSKKLLYKVIQNDFHLSLGKIYLISPERITREIQVISWTLFRESAEKLPLYSMSLSHGEFWEYFSDIIETQGHFGEKRHAGKITLKDARLLREKITGNFEKEGFLKIILEHTGIK
jgi:hypothetical protein